MGVVLPLFCVSTIYRDRCRPYETHAVTMGKEVKVLGSTSIR